MCLYLTENEIKTIKDNFYQKLESKGYPVSLPDSNVWLSVYISNFGGCFTKVTFDYFFLKYEVQVDDIDGIFYMTEIIYDLEKKLDKSVESENVIRWQDIGKGHPSREVILDHLKNYTPEQTYWDYIYDLHFMIGE